MPGLKDAQSTVLDGFQLSLGGGGVSVLEHLAGKREVLGSIPGRGKTI